MSKRPYFHPLGCVTFYFIDAGPKIIMYNSWNKNIDQSLKYLKTDHRQTKERWTAVRGDYSETPSGKPGVPNYNAIDCHFLQALPWNHYHIYCTIKRMSTDKKNVAMVL